VILDWREALPPSKPPPDQEEDTSTPLSRLKVLDVAFLKNFKKNPPRTPFEQIIIFII
jgi:hypothetical protein